MAEVKGKLTGPQKAAMLMIILGEDVSPNVFRHLKDSEIEDLTTEITRLPRVENETKEEVLNEFQQMMLAQGFISQGGADYAREVLERSIGKERAEAILNRSATMEGGGRPLDFIRKIDPSQLFNFIQHEHPQTIALVLSYLSPNKSAEILPHFSEDIQANITERIATLDKASPEVIRSVEEILKNKLSSFAEGAGAGITGKVGGVNAVVDLFKESEKAVQQAILEKLTETNPELAEKIRKQMFIFEDILKIDDRSFQKVLREADTATLALALKGAPDTIKEKIFNNLPKRTAAMVEDELSFLGPQKASAIDEAQQKIIAVVRQMEDSGEIIIAGGKGEALIE